MQTKNWSFLTRALHWLTVPLLVVCVAAVWAHEGFDKTDPVRAQLMQVHFLAGGLLGMLMLTRLANRLISTAPAHALPKPLVTAAKAGHFALYAVMLLLPVCGYIAVSGKGAPINLLNLITLPPAPVSADLAHTFKEVHEGLANTVLALVGLHIAAALYHAFVLRDKVLRGMLGTADKEA